MCNGASLFMQWLLAGFVTTLCAAGIAALGLFLWYAYRELLKGKK